MALNAQSPAIPLSGTPIVTCNARVHLADPTLVLRLAKHAFARIMREKGDRWETVRIVLEEDLRHRRCFKLGKDRRLKKIMKTTWQGVSKVTF